MHIGTKSHQTGYRVKDESPLLLPKCLPRGSHHYCITYSFRYVICVYTYKHMYKYIQHIFKCVSAFCPLFLHLTLFFLALSFGGGSMCIHRASFLLSCDLMSHVMDAAMNNIYLLDLAYVRVFL